MLKVTQLGSPRLDPRLRPAFPRPFCTPSASLFMDGKSKLKAGRTVERVTAVRTAASPREGRLSPTWDACPHKGAFKETRSTGPRSRVCWALPLPEEAACQHVPWRHGSPSRPPACTFQRGFIAVGSPRAPFGAEHAGSRGAPRGGVGPRDAWQGTKPV